jgi:transcriptional regulator with XRE-family HTH domain
VTQVGDAVDKVIERLKTEFGSEEARYAYADSVTNAFVTGQIKELREARNLTQDELADLVGTKQSGISRWLNSGFSSCKVETLRKFARAFGVRLRISFEEFGTLPSDVKGFTNDRLAPRKFEDDPAFKAQAEEPENNPSTATGQLTTAQLETLARVSLYAGPHMAGVGLYNPYALAYPPAYPPAYLNSYSLDYLCGPGGQSLEAPPTALSAARAKHGQVIYIDKKRVASVSVNTPEGSPYVNRQKQA